MAEGDVLDAAKLQVSVLCVRINAHKRHVLGQLPCLQVDTKAQQAHPWRSEAQNVVAHIGV